MSEQLLQTILKHSTSKNSCIHGPIHWASVAVAGFTLCELTPEADPQTVLYFAMLHDAMRENDGHDPAHGKRAANLAQLLRESGDLGLDERRLAVLEEALVYHDKGRTSANPTIGACWDADRIALPRVHINPRASLMSTKGGKAHVGTMRGRYYSAYRFSWESIFLNFDLGPWTLSGSKTRGGQVFLRFGDPPANGRSHFSSATVAEDGVSVYRGLRLGLNSYQVDTRRLMLGTETRLLRLILQQCRPLYVVEGDVLGMGGSGEALLANVRIVHQVTPAETIEVLPRKRELAKCVDWWKAKSRGVDPGPFPHPFPHPLDCDRPDNWNASIAPYNPWASGWRAWRPGVSAYGDQIQNAKSVIEETKRGYLKRWGLLEIYDEQQAEMREAREQQEERIRRPQVQQSRKGA